MDLSKFGRALKYVDKRIKEAEKYLNISGKHSPSSLAAHSAYQVAMDKISEIEPQTPKQKTAYEGRVRKLYQLAARIITTGTEGARTMIGGAREFIDNGDEYGRMAAKGVQNPHVDEEWFKGYAESRKQADYEWASRFLIIAENELRAMGDVAQSADSVELNLMVRRQQDRIVNLRSELEKKQK